MLNTRDEALKMESEATPGMCVVGGYLDTSRSHSADWRAGKCFFLCQEAGAGQSLSLAPLWLQAHARGLCWSHWGASQSRAEQLPAMTSSIVRKPGSKYIAHFTGLKVCV